MGPKAQANDSSLKNHGSVPLNGRQGQLTHLPRGSSHCQRLRQGPLRALCSHPSPLTATGETPLFTLAQGGAEWAAVFSPGTRNHLCTNSRWRTGSVQETLSHGGGGVLGHLFGGQPNSPTALSPHPNGSLISSAVTSLPTN